MSYKKFVFHKKCFTFFDWVVEVRPPVLFNLYILDKTVNVAA